VNMFFNIHNTPPPYNNMFRFAILFISQDINIIIGEFFI